MIEQNFIDIAHDNDVINLFSALKLNQTWSNSNRPFYVSAGDYERAIFSSARIPVGTEIIRIRDSVAYAINQTANITIIWIPIKTNPNGAIAYVCEGLIGDFNDMLDKDPIWGYGLDLIVTRTKLYDLVF